LPGVMPGFVGKGPIFAKLDALLADPAKRQTFLTRISKKKPNGKWDEELLDAVAAMLPLSNAEKDHIEEHWFGTGYEAWWPRLQPAQIICRLGLIQAIQLAAKTNPAAPIATYWVCGVNDFQLVSLVAPSGAVTVLIFTPVSPVPDQMPGAFTAGLEEIYTVRHKSLGPGEKLLVDDDFCEVVQAYVPKN
jgi:hypothetical protein